MRAIQLSSEEEAQCGKDSICHHQRTRNLRLITKRQSFYKGQLTGTLPAYLPFLPVSKQADILPLPTPCQQEVEVCVTSLPLGSFFPCLKAFKAQSLFF